MKLSEIKDEQDLKSTWTEETGLPIVSDAEKAAYLQWVENKLIEEIRNTKEEIYVLPSDQEIDLIISKKFHGFSSEQWEDLKNQFPYNEIQYIVKNVLSEIKGIPKELSEEEANQIRHNLYEDEVYVHGATDMKLIHEEIVKHFTYE